MLIGGVDEIAQRVDLHVSQASIEETCISERIFDIMMRPLQVTIVIHHLGQHPGRTIVSNATSYIGDSGPDKPFLKRPIVAHIAIDNSAFISHDSKRTRVLVCEHEGAVAIEESLVITFLITGFNE